MDGKTFFISGESSFTTTRLEKLEYFDGTLKRNYKFLQVLQKMMCYYYRQFMDNTHRIC